MRPSTGGGFLTYPCVFPGCITKAISLDKFVHGTFFFSSDQIGLNNVFAELAPYESNTRQEHIAHPTNQKVSAVISTVSL
jgi:hypothetical protein